MGLDAVPARDVLPRITSVSGGRWSVKRLLCLGRSHKPVSTILSSNRIFCRRCGVELEYLKPEEPAKREEIQTTIKRVTRSTFR